MSDTESAAFNTFEAAGWQQRSQAYDRFFAGITGRLADPLLDAAGIVPGTKVLDVATGPGYVAAAALRRGADVVAVDIAPAMVALARRRSRGLDVRVGDAESLPFGDGSFGAVLSGFGLMHLGDPERAVADFARVTARNGRVAVSVWDRPDRGRLAGLFADAVAEAGAAPPDEVPPGPAFFRFADSAALERLLRGAGLADPRVEVVSFAHRVGSAAELWDAMLAATVRTSATITGQTPETRRRIRSAYERLAAAYADADGLAVPVSVLIGSAQKL
ncbi:class I SAM-dependent methyltransferase [Cryptosporangium aurantiacum]|uniref:Ubiquinone/menaquinone biosynthesis C-methylase UbiE n=1 Tax=Cryptosporangium aurantiacum TaxID=134849 RepID=A0A1M7RQ67_9ACTN|nr:class I SAM-dependent methyltransferase [Cryptosporangium aurantiacum]SHN48232.1 Ubiquinone/menaquinone biosynthesis C-methylase UbiE [Cryptosporangium aurantiacum]